MALAKGLLWKIIPLCEKGGNENCSTGFANGCSSPGLFYGEKEGLDFLRLSALLRAPPVLSRHARCRPYIVSGPAQGPPSPGFPSPPYLPGNPAGSALHKTTTSRRGSPVLCATSSPKSGHRARPLGTGITSRRARRQNKSCPPFLRKKDPAALSPPYH